MKNLIKHYFKTLQEQFYFNLNQTLVKINHYKPCHQEQGLQGLASPREPLSCQFLAYVVHTQNKRIIIND